MLSILQTALPRRSSPKVDWVSSANIILAVVRSHLLHFQIFEGHFLPQIDFGNPKSRVVDLSNRTIVFDPSFEDDGDLTAIPIFSTSSLTSSNSGSNRAEVCGADRPKLANQTDIKRLARDKSPLLSNYIEFGTRPKQNAIEMPNSIASFSSVAASFG